MKKVLMTNLYFEKYSGSELHISEMARLFERKGYDVTIAVFRKAYPLMTEMRKLHIIECQSEELKEFDFEKLIDECVETIEEIVINDTYKQNNDIF